MHRNSSRLVVLGSLVASACAVVHASGPGDPRDGGAPHGAAAFEAQGARLDELLGKAPAGSAHGSVDASIWAWLVPEPGTPTPERVLLGRKLYFDTRLSADNTVACATCHDVTRGFTDRRNVSEGINDKLGRRNAPTTLNAALLVPQFLDGRAATLDDQARQPILNPIEMGNPNGDAVVARLAATPDYPPLFLSAFGRDLNYTDLGHAIAAFERTLIFMDAPFDAFRRGDTGALSAAEQRGLELFENKARCATCHPLNPANPIGSDMKFHNIGVSAHDVKFGALAAQALAALASNDSEQALDRLALSTDFSELGRFMITKKYCDVGAFRSSQLRNVGLTAPYMHDGSLQTLWDVVDHYNKGGETNPYLDGGITPLALEEREIDDLVAFLFTLTDRRFDAENRKELDRQRALSRNQRPFRDDARAKRERLGFEAPTNESKGK